MRKFKNILCITGFLFYLIPGVLAGVKENKLVLSATYTKTNVSACGNGSDGTITLTLSGGVAPYTYSWTSNYGFTSTAGSLTGLPIGYYSVVITDATLATVTLTDIHMASAFYIYITNSGGTSSSCVNNGSIILYGNAGVKPYTYSLNGTTYQAGNTFTNLAPGNYTAYMKDAAGCVSSKIITVASLAPVTVTAFIHAASSCSNDGVVELFRAGGSAPYTYSLNGVTYQTSNVFPGLSGGSVVTGWVKDALGCVGSLPGITVTQGAGLTVTMSKTNSSTCVVDGTIQMNASGGIPPFIYSLNDVTFQSSNSFTGLKPGNYFGYVRDSRGCKGLSYTTIGLNPIIVTANAVSASNCITNNGSIQLFHTGGTGSVTYSLDASNYQYTNTFTGLAAGIYKGYIKDANICIGVLSGIVVGPVCAQGGNPGNTSGNNLKNEHQELP